MGFQEMYFQNQLPPEYEIQPKDEMRNQPVSVLTQKDKEDMPDDAFVARSAQEIVQRLGLEKGHV
jgi:hypothetical protein